MSKNENKNKGKEELRKGIFDSIKNENASVFLNEIKTNESQKNNSNNGNKK